MRLLTIGDLFSIVITIESLLEVTDGACLVVFASGVNIAYFNANHGGLRDDPQLRLYEIPAALSQCEGVHYTLRFLEDPEYEPQVFKLMQKRWNGEIIEVLSGDLQLSRPHIFSGKASESP